MSTLVVILLMVGVAVALLALAIIYDRILQRRTAKRHQIEEAGGPAAKKRDAADAVIDILNRTGDIMRSVKSAAEDEQGQGQHSAGA